MPQTSPWQYKYAIFLSQNNMDGINKHISYINYPSTMSILNNRTLNNACKNHQSLKLAFARIHTVFQILELQICDLIVSIQ